MAPSIAVPPCMSAAIGPVLTRDVLVARRATDPSSVPAVTDAEVKEPVPPERGPGRVILLNGASSSGKSTLAAALQDALDEPFLHVSSERRGSPPTW